MSDELLEMGGIHGGGSRRACCSDCASGGTCAAMGAQAEFSDSAELERLGGLAGRIIDLDRSTRNVPKDRHSGMMALQRRMQLRERCIGIVDAAINQRSIGNLRQKIDRLATDVVKTERIVNGAAMHASPNERHEAARLMDSVVS